MKWPVAVAMLAFASRCTRSDPDPAAPPSPSASAAVQAPEPSLAPLDVIGTLPTCDVDYQGLFLDIGGPGVEARRDHATGPFADTTVSERSGATFARVYTKRLAYDFGLPAPARRVGVTMRAIGGASRRVTVYLDERRLGTVTLPREEPGVLSVPPTDELPAGNHTVTLRFGGSAQGADEAYGEVDWIRIGPPDGAPAGYAAPTLRDLVTDVVLGGDPKRAIVLRAGSSVRCTIRVTPGMKLRTSAGYWGNGQGVASVKVFEDGEAPVTLVEHPVSGGAGAKWAPLDLDLEPFAGRVVALEVAAPESTGGGRVAFGEPFLLAGRSGSFPRSPRARVAVVVVMSGLDRRMIPPWGPASALPAMGRLARDGVAFDRYRAPTTVVSAVVASLLTGLPPRAHGMEDAVSRLGEYVRLVGERAKEGNAHAALFTGVPMTFPSFGFDRGWDRYAAFSPVKDVPATEPLVQGALWLKEQMALDRETRVLLVVHARGGHPPWDVTRDEVALLPPEEYSGALEPRAGALVLGNLRYLRGPSDQHLSGDDWRRLRALEEASLKKQDAALRRLIDGLEKEGLYDGSLVVLMGDVAAGDPPAVPFAPTPLLREDVLLAPLVVKFPGGALAGTEVATMATTLDVTATVLGALGLATDGVEGVDLLAVAHGELPLGGRPLVATLGSHYSTRWGPWLLSGDVGRRPSLCLVDVDPACATDAYAQSPLAAQGLWRRTFDFEVSARAVRGREKQVPAVHDAETQAALKVFGY